MKTVSTSGEDEDYRERRFQWEEAVEYAVRIRVRLSSHHPLGVVVISHGRRLNGGPHHRAAM